MIANVVLDSPADNAGLEQYDGIGWTGCSLTIFEDRDPCVQGQIAIARAAPSVATTSGPAPDRP